MVGSGGSLSAAHLVADLYETTVGVPARVETPLGLPRALRSLRTCNVLILSAGGRNRDILGACRQAIEFEPKQLSVVCATEGSPLAKLARTYDGAAVLEFELPTGRDGFLATNSLLATAVLMTRAIGGATTERLLPATFKSLAKGCQGVRTGVASEHFFERETLLVLHGDQTRAGAINLESKLTEAALARVQVADYRNFAHGRHHWLAKRPHESAVPAFEHRLIGRWPSGRSRYCRATYRRCAYAFRTNARRSHRLPVWRPFFMWLISTAMPERSIPVVRACLRLVDASTTSMRSPGGVLPRRRPPAPFVAN